MRREWPFIEHLAAYSRSRYTPSTPEMTRGCEMLGSSIFALKASTPSNELLGHIAPLGWEHIAPTGNWRTSQYPRYEA